MAGKRNRAKEKEKPISLPYQTMSIEQITAMPIGEMANEGCHLWLWTTNQTLEDGFKVMRAWGFKYLAPIHWIKRSGQGNWFIHRTQTILFGYKEKCKFPMKRYAPNIIDDGTDPVRHSQKPESSFRLIESITPPSRLELFARIKRPGWSSWGNEIESDIEL